MSVERAIPETNAMRFMSCACEQHRVLQSYCSRDKHVTLIVANATRALFISVIIIIIIVPAHHHNQHLDVVELRNQSQS